MIVEIVYVLAVLLFALVFTLTRLPRNCTQALVIAEQAMSVITDRNLDDEAKESATQQAALKMLKQGGLITIKAVITLAATVLPVFVADAMALSSWQNTSEFAMRWDVLLVTTVVMLTAWWIWRRFKIKKT